MSTEPQELTLVSPDESNQVETMKRADIGAVFKSFETEAAPILEQAKALVVTDATQVAVMRVADQYRKEIKKIRCAVDVRRKELVADLNKQTDKINGAARTIREQCEEAEQRLLEISEFAEREILRIEDSKREARCAELKPFLTGPLSVDLGKLSDEDYAKMLADAKDLHTLREERIRKEREAAEAQAKAEAEERERIRLENERLKKQAEEAAKARAEAEAVAKAEREEANRLAREAKARADAELKAAQDKAEEERKVELEASRKREAQLAAAAKREREIAEAAAKKQRDEVEARARAEAQRLRAEALAEKLAAEKENARLAGIAEQERQKAAAAAREAKEAREKIEREETARKADEAKAEADRLAAEEAARLAPEKDKLMAFAAVVRALVVPTLETDKGNAVAVEIESQVVKFAAFIEKKAGAL